ncbi:MAG: secretin N-terminal domain-containing protein [Candidatus Omnitrophota bacterium]|nr:secretin N-terminal domain-containing protein [Candidatus Omnitrophota bacterium]
MAKPAEAIPETEIATLARNDGKAIQNMNKKIILPVLMLSVVIAVTGLAYNSNQQDMEQGLAKDVSLDLRGMDIIDTLKFLAMKGDLNIATSKNVKGRITLFLNNVTISDVLDLILLTNNLACEKKNDIITIMTEAEYEMLYGEKYSDKRQVNSFKLKYSTATKMGETLANIKSSIGRIIMDDATGTVILVDTPEKIKEMEEIAFDLDKGIIEKQSPTDTRVFELQYATVEDLSTGISEALTPDVGSIRTDERTNKIIVQDLPYKLKEIEQIIAAFDTRTKEVFIEARIVEITLNDDFAMGVNWDSLFSTITDIGIVGSFPIAFPAGAVGSLGRVSIGKWKEGFFTDEGAASEEWHSGRLDPRKANAALTFLRTLGEVKIVSSPHIAVCNNEEAQIMVGTRQPYATSTISQSETSATTSWSAEFVDVGITLTVTPTINKDGFVRMHIKPEVSTLRDWFEITDEAGTAQIRLPEVDTSNAETDVLVEDGKTIIIAGLISERDYENEDKFPVLGDIPVLGNLFKSKSKGSRTRELVIFLTPHIIHHEKKLPAKKLLSSKDDFHHFRLGLSYEQNKDYLPAIEEYEEVLKINPVSAVTHLRLANIYHDYIKDSQKAEYHFKQHAILTALKEKK